MQDGVKDMVETGEERERTGKIEVQGERGREERGREERGREERGKRSGDLIASTNATYVYHQGA